MSTGALAATQPDDGGAKDRAHATRALNALNFFMADMQAGIGPFLGVFLLAHHWHNATIGTMMTLGGLAGMAATVPAGAIQMPCEISSMREPQMVQTPKTATSSRLRLVSSRIS